MGNDRGRGIESITPTSSPNTSYHKRSKSSRQNEVLTFSRFLSFFFFFFLVTWVCARQWLDVSVSVYSFTVCSVQRTAHSIISVLIEVVLKRALV